VYSLAVSYSVYVHTRTDDDSTLMWLKLIHFASGDCDGDCDDWFVSVGSDDVVDLLPHLLHGVVNTHRFHQNWT
jgi:hypothetical protein